MPGHNGGAQRERNPIAALTRVLGVMAAMDQQSVGLRELARMLSAPPSSVQRTLESAEELSLVASSGGQWELGWELFRLASIVQAKHPFQGAEAVLDELSASTGETALLAVYDARRRERMFAAASQSRQSVRFVPELFSWLPMHAGASALAILAYRPDEERQALYAQGAPPVTPGTTPEAVESALDEVRTKGYAVTHDGIYLGASGVAAPIVTGTGVTSSVAVIVPKQRFDDEREATIAGHVKAAAKSLGRRLGDPSSGLAAVPQARSDGDTASREN
jgi:IclR family transcriptional regulator, acetate operon repressor